MWHREHINMKNPYNSSISISSFTYRLSSYIPVSTYSKPLLESLSHFNQYIQHNDPISTQPMPTPTLFESPFDITLKDMEFMMEHIDEGILGHDREQKIVYSNPTAAHFLGFSDTESMLQFAQTHGSLLHDEQYTYLDLYKNTITNDDLPWKKVTTSNHTHESIITITTKKTQHTKRLHIKSQLRETPNGAFMIVSKITDITDVATLERQKDEFMSMASHELKTPITSMKVFTQALQRVFEKDHNTEPIYYLGKIEGQLNKLTLLVKELLDVSRLQTGRLELHKEHFVMDDVVADICQQMQYTTDKHTITFRKHCGKTIYADRERFSQVLVNLISNAIKYSPEKTAIVIQSHTTNSHAIISIKDEGIGISKEYQKHIFDRFSKSDGDEESTFPGMGVGLYIVSQIIKRHNGTIEVKSKKKRGSTFTVTLPLNYTNET